MNEWTNQQIKQTNKQNERTLKFILGKVILKPLRQGGFAGVIRFSRDVYCLCIVPFADLWPSSVRPFRFERLGCTFLICSLAVCSFVRNVFASEVKFRVKCCRFWPDTLPPCFSGSWHQVRISFFELVSSPAHNLLHTFQLHFFW